jgi:predicted DNA-binding protein (MmcQ/YjbR family)
MYNFAPMNVDDIREYCIAKDDVEEGFPFDEDTLVFKVKGKMFLLVSLTARPVQFNVKCDPDRATELREQYPNVIPGFHMSKVHWNSVIVDGSMNNKLLREQIDHSYSLVAAGKKKTTKKQTGKE